MNSSMTKNQGNGLSGRNGSNFRRISLSNGFEDHDFFLSNKRNIDRRGGRTDEINGDRSTSASCDTWRNGYVDGGKAGLAGNNFVLRRTAASTTGIVPGRNSANPSTIVRRKRRESLLGEDLSSRLLLEDSSASDSTNFGKSQRPTRNPFSVSNFLREGLSAARKSERKPNEESILKRSSTFLANLTHTASKYKERSTRETSPRLVHSQPSAKGYSSILNNVSDGFASLRRSPSVQTLPVQRRRKNTGRVKKSVSFSSDTSFEEKRVPYRKVPVHEVKIYHKGVLQDRSTRETIPIAKVPSSWETNSSEGRTALLGAAREADDVALEEIVSQVRTFGLGAVDVNAVDSSGRTALSYMAGNGASTMLDLALSFDGVDPNIPDNEGNTPLHFAAQAGQTECLNILLQRCPDIEVDARNASGFTPLMKAALQGRTKCAKILLFAGANPTLRDHGRGLRAEQWARFCGRYVCAEVIERFARHRLLERSTTCRWGSEPELAAKMLQGKIMPIPNVPLTPPCSGLRSKIRKVFRTTSSPDRNFSLVSQLTSAALCASSPALPKASDVPPVVKSLLRPLSVPQLRVTLVPQPDFLDQSKDRYGSNSSEKIENAVNKITRSKKKSK